MNFSDMGLDVPILDAITELGYKTPSPIQTKAIPAVLRDQDVMAAAQTGTGKTAAFTLPILQRLSKGECAQGNQVRALILAPTRELAAQINDSVSAYGKNMSLRSTMVCGGVKINPQIKKLCKGVDILVATPGRLLDLYSQGVITFKRLEVLVLDEADRMLDMGFIRDIQKIISYLPRQRQNLLFSATFSQEIRKLAKGLLNNPIEVSVNQANTTVENVKQWICPVDKKKKSHLLFTLIVDNNWKQVLVFARTKHGVNRLTRYLVEGGIKAEAIHGNKSQAARTKALANFKQGSISVLVATDIAARGLDIDQLPHVVNFDLPHVPEDYVHRIGRTARAGAKGEAISLVSADEFKQLSDIERLIKQQLTRQNIEGFDPIHQLPVSGTRPSQSKKKTKSSSGKNRFGRGSRGSKHSAKKKKKPTRMRAD